MDYGKVMKEVDNSMTPKKNEVYLHMRFMFYNCKQKEDKSFHHFLTNLKKLKKNCEFELIVIL